jgi:hypothetical protein
MSGPTRGEGLAVAVVVLPLVYVLSLGPMFGLFGRSTNHRVQRLFEVVYLPLGLLSERSDGARQFFRWYVHLWERP